MADNTIANAIKFLKGEEKSLPATKTEGQVYFAYKDVGTAEKPSYTGAIYIDTPIGGTQTRIKMTANADIAEYAKKANADSSGNLITGYLRNASLSGNANSQTFTFTAPSGSKFDLKLNGVSDSQAGLVTSGDQIFPGYKTLKLRAKPSSIVGSDNENSNGWYKVATSTMNGYNNTNILYYVKNGCKAEAAGILSFEMRCNNTTVQCWTCKWLVRDDGIEPDMFRVVINGTTWTLYVYQSLTQWGRISITEISHTDASGDNPIYNITYYNSNTKETTEPDKEISSSDGGQVYLASKATNDGNGQNIANTYIKFLSYSNDGKQLIATRGSGDTSLKLSLPIASTNKSGIITTDAQSFGGTKTFVTINSNSLTVTGSDGFNYSGIGSGTNDVARPVWFADSSGNGKPVVSSTFTYNPATQTLKVANLSGTADKATSAGNADKVGNYHVNEIYNAAKFQINNYSATEKYIQIAKIVCSNASSLEMVGFTILFSNRECLDSTSFILTLAIRRNSADNISGTFYYNNIQSTSPKDIFVRSNDGQTFYVYFTSELNSWTTYYNVTPIMTEGNITFSNIKVTEANLVVGTKFKMTASKGGNAATADSATKLATARTISLTGSVTGSGIFDGSGNLSIITTTNHSHNQYLPLTGGTMTGALIAPSVTASNYFKAPILLGDDNLSTYYHRIDLGHTNVNYFDFYEYGGIYNFYQNQSIGKDKAVLLGKITSNGWEGNVTGNLSGNATTATALTTSSAGSSIQPVYFSGGKPVACTYTLNKSVPADAKFTDTNTWRGIQDNLTSTSTSDSLSANQGRMLKGLIDGKAASNHGHNIIGLPRVTKDANTTAQRNTFKVEEFSSGTNYNLPSDAWYHIFTSQGDDINYATQLALGMTTTDIAYRIRNGSATAWNGWNTIIHSGNYTSYTVTKTGTGASGTWGINVSGNAATAAKLQTARTISLTGSVTGSAAFDGSNNITITTSTNHSHSQYLPLAGGTMTGSIGYGAKGYCYIGSGASDAANMVGGGLNNLVISSWQGISFTTTCSSIFTSKNAVSIDCRNGILAAASLRVGNGSGSTINFCTNGGTAAPGAKIVAYNDRIEFVFA